MNEPVGALSCRTELIPDRPDEYKWIGSLYDHDLLLIKLLTHQEGTEQQETTMPSIFLLCWFASILPLVLTQQPLTTTDQLTIINQLNLHQTYIDNDATYINATKWLSLYWLDANFTEIDLFGVATKTGADPSNDEGLKFFYDYDHSVFPLKDWFHTVGVYQFVDLDADTLVPVYNAENQTRVHWRWRVDWKTNTTGVVSTGTYDDVFENRNGVWKCLSRTSTIDGNWPGWIFRPYQETANVRFMSSKPTNQTS